MDSLLRYQRKKTGLYLCKSIMLSELIKSRTGLISAGYLEIRTFIMSVTYKYMDNDDVDYNSKYIQYIYFESLIVELFVSQK